MFNDIYKHLKNNRIDVYSIGQHEGLCKTPYVVVKENGVGEIAGSFLVNDTVDLLVYYPVGGYSSLKAYTDRIKTIMKTFKGAKRVIEAMPTVIDDDKKAYTTSFRYNKIKTKEGA